MAATGRPTDKEYQQYYNQYYQQYKQEYQQPGQHPQQHPQQRPTNQQRPPSNGRRPPQKHPPRRRRGGVGKWIALGILLILLLVVIANKDTVIGLLDGGAQYREYPEELQYTISRMVTMSGNGYRLSHMRVPEPDDIVTLGGTFIQKIHSSTHNETTGVSFAITNETAMWGANATRAQNWWEWTMPSDVSGVAVIEKTHHVTSKTVRWNLNADKTGMLSDITSSNDPTVVNLRNKYLGTEWKITPSEPSIQAVASEIKEIAGQNVYEIIRQTYLFLDNEFTYETGVQLEPKDATVTLSSRRGDCDDQSILMASILRSCGIPAWLEIGGLYDRQVEKWGGHAWLKVWVPMLDENGVFTPEASGTVDIDVVNDEFMFRSCYRYAEWESDGDGRHLQDYYMFISFFGSPTINVDWDSSILSSSGSERYLTNDGEVAAPGFGAVAAVATLALVGAALRVKRRRD